MHKLVYGSKWHTDFKEHISLDAKSLCVITGMHKEIPICECGQNTTCLNCGYGQGAIPCKCSERFLWQPAALTE